MSRAVRIVHNVEIGDDTGVPLRLVDGTDHARACGIYRLGLRSGASARRLDILRERALDARDGVDRRVHARARICRRCADLFEEIDIGPRISVRGSLLIELTPAGGRLLRGKIFFARVRLSAAFRDLGGRVPVRSRRSEHGTARKRDRHHRRNEQRRTRKPSLFHTRYLSSLISDDTLFVIIIRSPRGRRHDRTVKTP